MPEIFWTGLYIVLGIGALFAVLQFQGKSYHRMTRLNTTRDVDIARQMEAEDATKVAAE